MKNVWTVPAEVVRVVDGDTLEVNLDLGWNITYHTKVRLARVNCPELSEEAGQAAKAYVMELLGVAPGSFPRGVTVVSHSLDKYGRVLGSVSWNDEQGVFHDLGSELLASGHAVPM